MLVVVSVLFLLVEMASLWAGVKLTRTITGAVNELYEGTQHVRQGDFTYRIPVKGDDQLAEARVRDAVARAEFVQEPAAFDAQTRLQRPRRIVEAGVDHAAVVRARFEAGARMPLEDAHRSPALGNRERRGEAGDAGADDRDIDPFHPRQRF